MEIYILTITFLNNENSIEYVTVKGAYNDKEIAKKNAVNEIKKQQALWRQSYVSRLSTNKVALVSPLDGFSKIYHIIKEEVK